MGWMVLTLTKKAMWLHFMRDPILLAWRTHLGDQHLQEIVSALSIFRSWHILGRSQAPHCSGWAILTKPACYESWVILWRYLSPRWWLDGQHTWDAKLRWVKISNMLVYPTLSCLGIQNIQGSKIRRCQSKLVLLHAPKHVLLAASTNAFTY